jgi:protoheme IX farnesyltransferase
LAIAWIYRDDYAQGGYKMLPLVDPTGERTGRQAVSHTLGLLPVTLSPFIFQMAGPFYCMGAFVLGLAFFWSAWKFRQELSVPRARQLFYLSIIYLPLLLAMMVMDKIKN